MALIERYLTTDIRRDLEDKMVFLGGPRQVGKTTLALQFLTPSRRTNPAYLNWDASEHRAKLRSGEFPSDVPLVVLDEIHKFKRWRGLVKGFYDTYFPELNFLVTGSARLDYYRKGGDSLQGRYHYWRLHPFSLRELGYKNAAEHLLAYGGFPEPCAKGDKQYWRRWSRERLDRVVREDLRDLENVRELSLIELLVDALPERVGSLLSLNSLAEDLQVSPRSIDRWIEILERLYLCFRISPYGTSRVRAVKKARKLYLWDWAAVSEKGARFENMVAAQLLKYCHYREDHEGYRMELRYLRDKDEREIDFVVLQERKPMFAVECKSGEKELSKAISYYSKQTIIPRFYQVHLGKKTFGIAEKGGQVIPFEELAEKLKLP